MLLAQMSSLACDGNNDIISGNSHLGPFEDDLHRRVTQFGCFDERAFRREKVPRFVGVYYPGTCVLEIGPVRPVLQEHAHKAGLAALICAGNRAFATESLVLAVVFGFPELRR